jgi:hypothetical protein
VSTDGAKSDRHVIFFRDGFYVRPFTQVGSILRRPQRTAFEVISDLIGAKGFVAVSNSAHESKELFDVSNTRTVPENPNTGESI